MSCDRLPPFIRENYEIHEWKHACAILYEDYRNEFDDIVGMLKTFRLKKSWIQAGGGRKTKVAEAIDSALYKRGWEEKHFETEVVVDEDKYKSPTHKVDCFKNGIALEVEWNNKDPFFDRDLNNFRLLFDLRVVGVGIIITRCTELQKIFKKLGLEAKYGASTTHMDKLLPRIEGGGGGGCPILVFGIRESLIQG